ncbi:hypothetical protein TAL182_PB00055 (plasmid) [Rhizobium sp. TAL182]|nr:hypothetical protein TAL182_PB00055 [Rhizobium sp. TAL182]
MTADGPRWFTNPAAGPTEPFACADVITGQSIIGLYPATQPRNLEEFAAWRAKHGR